MINRLLVCLTVLCLACGAWAAPLKIQFEAFKVVANPDGTESFVAADHAAPGDLIEYRAHFSNSSDKPLHHLKPEIPVPAGLVLVPVSDKPAATEGSLDGTAFHPLPLRDVAGQAIATDKIRALRWSLPELKAGETRLFVLRASVAR